MANPHIVINKADKGSTIVVEDRVDYIKNAMIHLNDPSVFKPLSETYHHHSNNHRKTKPTMKKWPYKTNVV